MIKSARAIVVLLMIVGLCACQWKPRGGSSTVSTQPATDGPGTIASVSQSPTATSERIAVTATPEPKPTETKPIASGLLNGLRVTLAHPWMNETGDAFEALVDEFNRTNEFGLEVIPHRNGGYISLAEALLDEQVDDHIVIARGFDLAGADDGSTWINLSEAPRIEGVTTEVEICSGCASYLDDVHLNRYITLLYQPALLYYNQSWAKELGFEEIPRTLNELQNQLLTARMALLSDLNLDNDGLGGMWLSMSAESSLAWYRAFGGAFNVDDDLPNFDRNVIQDAFSYLKDLRTQNASWRAQNPTAHSYFVNRTALVYEGILEDLQTQEVAMEITQSGDKWLTIPYPTADGGGSVSMETIGISIRSSYESVEAAAGFFVRWLLEPKQMEKLVEATGLWPVGGNPQHVAPSFNTLHPAWASALSGDVRLTIAPEGKNWGISRLILQDATLRVYSLDAQYIPTILDMLDSTIKDLGPQE